MSDMLVQNQQMSIQHEKYEAAIQIKSTPAYPSHLFTTRWMTIASAPEGSRDKKYSYTLHNSCFLAPCSELNKICIAILQNLMHSAITLHLQIQITLPNYKAVRQFMHTRARAHTHAHTPPHTFYGLNE